MKTHKRIYILKTSFIKNVSYVKDTFCFPRKERANELINMRFAVKAKNHTSLEDIVKENKKEKKKKKEKDLQKDFPLILFK